MFRIAQAADTDIAGEPPDYLLAPPEDGPVRRGLRVDLFRPSVDMEAMLSLRATVWGAHHPHSSKAFQAWLYADAGLGEPRGVIARQRDGRVIGFVGLSRQRFRLNGSDTLAACGLDYMVRPRTGNLVFGLIALRMTQSWFDTARDLGCTFALAFPTANSNRFLTSQHIGGAPIYEPTIMIRPLLTAALTKRVHARVSRRATTAALWGAALNSRLISSLQARAAEVGEFTSEFGSEFDALWQRVAPELDFAAVRDARYLSWRYKRHPIHDYRCLTLRSEGQLNGFAITRPGEVLGTDGLLLVDFLASSWAPRSSAPLIEAVVKQAQDAHRDVVAALATPGTRFYRALMLSGFYPLPRWLVRRPFHAIGIDLYGGTLPPVMPARCHFTWGDVDVV